MFPRWISRFAVFGVCSLGITATQGADWNQWRGPTRDGYAAESPKLINGLPEEGLSPVWISSEKIPSGGDGGWSSPVVASNKVYIYAHYRTPGAEPPQPKYPALTDEQKAARSREDLAEYEKLRQEEELKLRREAPYEESIYCFDALHGQQLWRDTRPSVHTTFPQSGTPAVVDGRLYILCAGMKARCFDAASGKLHWECKLPGQFTYENLDSSFAIVEGLAVVFAERLTALDAQSGSIVWQLDQDKASGRHSSPVVWTAGARKLILLNAGSGNTICVDPKSGEVLWTVKSEAVASTPVITKDLLITLGDSRKKGLRVFRLTERGAEPIWTFQWAADPGSSPVVIDDHVYVQGEQRLACVDLASGKPKWRTTIDSNNPRYTSLIGADKKLFYIFDRLVALNANPEEHQSIMQAKLDNNGCWKSGNDEVDEAGVKQPLQCASPAICNGLLYVRLNDGLACYDLTAQEPLLSSLGDK